MKNEQVIYLQVNDPSKQWVSDRLTNLLNDESVVPSFPDVAMRLCTLVQKEDTTMDDFAKIIMLDTALAARPIDSIEQASRTGWPAFSARPRGWSISPD
jgi:hypothetical protein